MPVCACPARFDKSDIILIVKSKSRFSRVGFKPVPPAARLNLNALKVLNIKIRFSYS